MDAITAGLDRRARAQLAAQKKLIAARALLERHRLTDWRIAMGLFPGGWERRHWLAERLDAIMGRERQTRPRKLAVKPAPVQGRPNSPLSTKSAAPPPAQARPAAQPAIPTLERLQVDIPLVVDSDLRPLLAASTGQAEREGSWFILRERFAHLGLAEGFDELLCVPHFKGIEILWYQTETVRKVLKQFRGRVLLADEVGLGKTVEAGMVLKEYLLRGKRVLVLVPAPLVGQWREELETKFEISCVTTHDPQLREDPERFWAASRIIASLALARRREHVERLLAQSFDLVIVDEAHHLRDRASQSYKLVELVVGEAGAILGELEEERNFADLVLDAWLETTAVGQAEAFDALGRRLDEARTQYSDAKALDDALFGEEFETA